jgi:hypothetical protein
LPVCLFVLGGATQKAQCRFDQKKLKKREGQRGRLRVAAARGLALTMASAAIHNQHDQPIGVVGSLVTKLGVLRLMYHALLSLSRQKIGQKSIQH